MNFCRIFLKGLVAIMNYKIGTRGSKLAMVQADMVRERLQKAYPGDTFEICVIRTKGDRLIDVPLKQIGSKGIFVTEIEEQILADKVQLGVHSMKDMPAQPAGGLVFARAWEREDARDALILRRARTLEELPKGAVIGTGSRRRACQLLALRSDLRIVDIRGNVDTRLRKMQEQNLDGIILAAAGLKRLGMEAAITRYLEVDEMIPAPAQGILAIELKAENKRLLDMVNALADKETDKIAAAERGFLNETGGGCHFPVGAYCERTKEGCLGLRAMFGSESGSRIEYAYVTGDDPLLLAKEAADRIKKALEEERKVRGRVTLVGAGPGDAELITIKGLEAVREADCIIYDRLVPMELLKEAKPGCETIYVGKENHYHTLPQEEINALMARKACQYENVVRLKGGDSYVFGRGGEECIFLKKQGIECRVIPGISSAIAGPACGGIPVTHRGIASGFRVVTAHGQSNQLTGIDFSSMQNPKETLIFLMGLGKVEEIAEGLLNAGREKDTPAAVISHAASEDQKTVIGTLETIAQRTGEAGLTAPAVIVVGEVVSLREQILPAGEFLSGRRYLVPVIDSFVPEGKNNAFEERFEGTDHGRNLAKMLRRSGAQADEVVVGQIQIISCKLSVEMLNKADWLVFSSRNGVTGFFENLKNAGLDGRSLASCSIAVIGKQTKEALAGYGIRADFVSEKQYGEAFAQELAKEIPDGAAVYYFSAIKNSGSIEQGLKKSCNLITIPVYENKEVTAVCKWKDYDGIFITSASLAVRLFQNYDTNRPLPVVYSIGPKSTDCLKKLGIKEIIEAGEPSYEALAALLDSDVKI